MLVNELRALTTWFTFLGRIVWGSISARIPLETTRGFAVQLGDQELATARNA
jgi:hypothetical protein